MKLEIYVQLYRAFIQNICLSAVGIRVDGMKLVS